MGQIEKRGENTYRLVVSCGFDSQSKRQKKYKTIKLTPNLTQKQIQLELAVQLDKFEKEVQKGTYLDGNITLGEFTEKWLKDYAEPNLKPKTLANYKHLLQRILISLGHKKLDSIQPTHLIEFYKNLAESGIRNDYKYKLKENIISHIPNFEKKSSAAKVHSDTLRKIIKGGNTNKETADKICNALNKPISKIFDIINKDKKLSEKLISHHHRLISAMLNIAVQWQLISSNPAERVKPPRVTRKEAKYYDIEEVNQMLTLLENEPIKYRAIIHIVLFCGLRMGELCNLEWSDIDFENESISVSKQLQYLPDFGIYEMESAKTESGNRTISIPPTLIDLLKEYKAWQNDEIVKWGDKWIVSEKLFTKENGAPIFPDTPSKWFGKFIKRNNLPPLTFHQLRHTNASLLISQGVDIATIANRLGHADKSITLKTYTHVIKQQDREATIKLQNLLKQDKD